ncbi:Centromere DNA-binding protein complex CBF3 subunit domain-containing protein [Phytophthora infestans]|uniref:Centromere DNA-binding protein complex CBF3 subunit domain-containing protein n=1 Tax=Phytophthora infestans TaxID=4787 RepID=A0A8S9TW35_PHYIN|nr:Centromere DNA-binding protein complex CBF3 subunit domain-containing protein [Phytophthora infestans]
MDEYTRDNIANSQEIHQVVTDIITDHAAARPSNTVKQETSYVFEDARPRGNKRQKTKAGDAKALSLAGVEAYAKAVIDLYKLQQALLLNSHPHPRGKTYHDLFDTLKRSETERKRKNYADRALGTVLDGYNVEDMVQLTDYWLSQNDGVSLRDPVDFFLGHALLARGESRRFIEFPDMLTLELPDEGSQTCTPLVIIMNRGKTNQHGRIEYGAAMRCKNVNVCPLNAVALVYYTLILNRVALVKFYIASKTLSF